MSRRCRTRRSGWTWIELILGLAAIVLIAALLLPATQQVRSGRKSECQDHIHNLVIALHSYEYTHKTLPPGWVDQQPHGANWGWGAMLLPYIEQKPLYLRAGVEGPESLAEALWNRRRGGAAFSDRVIDVFTCPHNPTLPRLNTALTLVDSVGKVHRVATANYVGVFGPDWSLGPDGQPLGVFGRNTSTRFADVVDGLSQTMFIGERAGAFPGTQDWYLKPFVSNFACDGAVFWGVGGDGSQTFQHYTLGISRPGLNSRVLSGGKPGCSFGFSSPHPGGIQVGLGDAKVDFLSESIDPGVLTKLVGKANGFTPYR